MERGMVKNRPSLMPPRSDQRGLTMVELMIAVVLGSILMIGVIQLFSGMRASYQLNESLSRVQESGRFATQLISEDLRTAGYSGPLSFEPRVCFFDHPSGDDLAGECPSDEPVNPDTGDMGRFFEDPVQGFDYGMTPELVELTPEPLDSLGDWHGDPESQLDSDMVDALEGRILPGSDILVTRSLGGGGEFDAEPPPGGGSNLDIPDHDFGEDDLFVIQDASGYVFVGPANQVGHTNVTFPGQFDDAGCCTPPVTATGARDSAFFVGEGVDGEPALMQVESSSISGGAEVRELVSGIELMRLQYGVDTNDDGNVNRYERADWVDANNEWDRVLAVRAAMVARGNHRLTGVPQQEDIRVLGDDIVIDDGVREFQRQVYSTTVRLRNIYL